jgi:hypothetical protein
MRSIARGVVTATWLLCVPAANAQVQFPSPGPSEERPSIPDEKLDAAAAALEQVASVREEYQQRIEAAAPSDKQNIADEAKNALVKAINNQGLSVEEYNSILVVAQNDPVVRQKILQRIRPSPK